MPFVGLDLHKKEIEAVILGDDGNILLRTRFASTREALESFVRQHLFQQHRVALEATTNTWAVVAILQPFAAEVIVSNPLRTRAIAAAKIKTDRIDALVLAQLLRTDFLPAVWTPDAQTSQLRHQATERANLTADRTRLKNRVHAVLQQRLLLPPMDDLFSKAGMSWLAHLPLDPAGQLTLERHLRQLAQVETEIALVDQQLAVQAFQHPQVKVLMTLPGFDYTIAECVFSVLGDVTRFADADRAAAYFGLVPSTHQSGGHCYHGHITKQGSRHGRWLLIQAAQHLSAHPGPLGVFFRRIMKKKNRNVAVVAAARKLVTIAWHMLKNNEPYRYAQPKTVQAKLSRLRIRATGQKKKGGFAKGTPRPANYGKGVRTKAVPSLDQIYAAEQLPPLAESKPAEKIMLEKQKLDGFAAHIRQPHRVPRKSQP
jgi:transposase